MPPTPVHRLAAASTQASKRRRRHNQASAAGSGAGAAAWAAGILFGGACGAVASCLVPGVITLVPEISQSTGLPPTTVEHAAEVLVRHLLAVRDGCGLRSALVPPAVIAELRTFVAASGNAAR